MVRYDGKKIMKAFANLLDQLSYSHGRLRKLALMRDYFRRTPDPDRGYALAALTGTLDIPEIKSGQLKQLIAERTDPVLFSMAHHGVGDLAETIALMWPERAEGALPNLTDVAETLQTATRGRVAEILVPWLNVSDEVQRWALLKMVTGSLRIGVSERLAKTALFDLATQMQPQKNITLEDIEEVWHGLSVPYTELFLWLTEAEAPRPETGHVLTFRPLMLAHQLEESDRANADPAHFLAEWKWDGIRVQLVGDGQRMAMFSRTGEDAGKSFPDLMGLTPIHGVVDGELLVKRESGIASFNDLQQRLNRKVISKKMLADYPAHLRLYDILFDGEEDVRTLPLTERKTRLTDWLTRYTETNPRSSVKLDLSPEVPFADWHELAAQVADVRGGLATMQVEGFMLKKRESPYLAGRPKGYWYKWKRDPLTADVVLMYAARGHGKRSSFYSDYTFGAWTTDEAGAPILVPVGKAYSGYTDEELAKLDRWIRAHTRERFGPVRTVEYGIVFEVGFDAIAPSKRHKSGVAMRFPRILRIRWDKPYQEADTLEALQKFIASDGAEPVGEE